MTLREQFKKETGKSIEYFHGMTVADFNRYYIDWLEAKFTSDNSDYTPLTLNPLKRTAYNRKRCVKGTIK